MTSTRTTAAAVVLVAFASGCQQESDHYTTRQKVPGSNAVEVTRVDRPMNGPGPQAFSMHRPLGAVVTNGFAVLQNTGSHPLIIQKVSPVLEGKGLEFLGAKVAGTDRTTGLIQILPWPPVHPDLKSTVPAEGLRMLPIDDGAKYGYELLLGFRVTGPGRSAMTAVTIRYRDAKTGKSGEYTVPSKMAVCTGPERPATNASCRIPAL
jgi:hypothetical protein